jgi:hypothetical protein
MKLRILGDTLRLRLSQSDVQTLVADGGVEHVVHFGGRALTYAIVLGDGDDLAARYEGDRIVVEVPRRRGEAWASSAEVGMSAEQALDDGGALALLVEKDFKCLAPREGEAAYDGFPHPQAGKTTC